MNQQTPDKDQIFNAVVEVQDPQQRSLLLAELCGDDSQLRREIEDLLARDQQLGSFLESPPSEWLAGDGLTHLNRENIGHEIAASSSGAGLSVPCQWGPFYLTRVLGSGGMGVVYKAMQKSPKRTIAVKVLHPEFANDSEAACRFEREIELLGKIDYEGVVPVYEAGVVNDRRYYVMPLLSGGTLRQRTQQGHLETREAAEILVELAKSVASAHLHGIVHRDIKPANVLFGNNGRPRIADFGLAKLYDSSHGLTRTGQICGTPGYIAPERIAATNKAGDDRPADIYSLGAVLYEMLCGRPPFRGQSVWETMNQALATTPVAPTRLNPAVDRDLETICLKCLEGEPRRRYVSANELKQDLDRYLAGKPIKARPPGPIERLVRNVRSQPMRSGLIAATLLLVVAGMVTMYLLQQLSIRGLEMEATRRLRDGETYLARLAEASELMTKRQTPWRKKTLDLLGQAAKLDVPNRDETRLRSLLAKAAVQHDLEPVATILPGIWCDCLAFDPSGQYLALGQNKDAAGFSVWIYRTDDWEAQPHRVWIDCAQDTMERRLKNHPKPEDGAAKLPFHLMAGNWPSARVMVACICWRGMESPRNHESTFGPDPGNEVNRICFTDDSRTMWILSDRCKLRLIVDGAVQLHPDIGDEKIDDLAVSPIANAAFVIRKYQQLQRFSFGQIQPARSITLPQGGVNIGVSQDGRYLALDNEPKLQIWDTVGGQLRSHFDFEDRRAFVGRAGQPVFSHDDSLIATTSFERIVALWDIVQGKTIATHVVAERGGRPVIAMSPTQPLLVVTEHLKTTVFRITGIDELRTIAPSISPIKDMCVDQTGLRIATAGCYRGERNRQCLSYGVWSLEDSRPLMTYYAHKYTHFGYPERLNINYSSGERHLWSGNWLEQPFSIPVPVDLGQSAIELESPTHWLDATQLIFQDDTGQHSD